MSFPEAIQSGFSNYVNYSGRARRSEYWWWVLFTIIVDAVVGIFRIQALTSVVGLVLFLPSLFVEVRRLHDIGKSGWWVLLSLIPLIGTIILIVWCVKDSDPMDNAYGPCPKN